MLSKAERLDRKQFSHFYKLARRHHGVYTSILVVNQPRLKAGVVVSKKVARAAHVRNTLKRRTYALLQELATKRGLSGVIIIILKPAAAALSRREFPIKLLAEIEAAGLIR